MADRVARLTNLVALLLNAPRPLTLEEIADELEPEAPYPAGREALRQAFERDKKVLREEGIPVESVLFEDGSGRVGYVIRPEEYYLPELPLNDDERVALHLALAAVPLEGGWGSEAQWKLGDVSGADVPPLASLPSVEALPALFDGWRRRATVRFAYSGTQRELDPYGLLFRDGFWYVVGHDHGRGELRRFRADRIEGRVAVGDAGSFERPAGFDPADALPNQPFRIGAGEAEAERVLVQVDAVLADKVVGELGAAAVESRLDDGSVVVGVDVTNRAGLRSWVLGMRDHAAVVGPEPVREEIVDWLRAMAAGGGAGAGEGGRDDGGRGRGRAAGSGRAASGGGPGERGGRDSGRDGDDVAGVGSSNTRRRQGGGGGGRARGGEGKGEVGPGPVGPS